MNSQQHQGGPPSRGYPNRPPHGRGSPYTGRGGGRGPPYAGRGGPPPYASRGGPPPYASRGGPPPYASRGGPPPFAAKGGPHGGRGGPQFRRGGPPPYRPQHTDREYPNRSQHTDRGGPPGRVGLPHRYPGQASQQPHPQQQNHWQDPQFRGNSQDRRNVPDRHGEDRKRQKTNHVGNNESHRPEPRPQQTIQQTQTTNNVSQNPTTPTEQNPTSIINSTANDIDMTDEHLPFRDVTTGYWNDPTILKQELIAALPSDAQALQDLPPYDFPPDFQQRLQRSYTAVIRQLQQTVPKGRYYDSSSDDDDSDSDSSRVHMIAAPADPVLPYRYLLKQVAEHPAVHLGFHCYLARDFNKWCCCPLGPKLQKDAPKCKMEERKDPKAFVAHLKAEFKSGCKDHGAVLQFLTRVYSNMCQEGDRWYSHEAVTEDHEEQKGFVRVRNMEQFKLRISGSAEETFLMESFQGLSLQLVQSVAEIEKSIESRRELKLLVEQKKKEGIMRKAFIELVPEATKMEKEMFLNAYNEDVQTFEEYLDDVFEDRTYNVTLSYPFDMKNLFQAWSEKCKKHKSFNNKCTHCYMNQMLLCDSYWRHVLQLSEEGYEYLSVEHTYLIGFRVEKNGMQLEKKEGARVFLSEVWKQLGDLYFERSEDYFEPWKDAEHKNDKKMAEWSYRAVGRLIAFSLVHGIQVPKHILPPLLWVHLFRAADYLQADHCFQNYAVNMRANEESNVQELCETFGVSQLGKDEDYESFSSRIIPVILDRAKEQDRIYSSTRTSGWNELKDGFEYPLVRFASKQKHRRNLLERLSLCVRECLAGNSWEAVDTILAPECMDEEGDY